MFSEREHARRTRRNDAALVRVERWIQRIPQNASSRTTSGGIGENDAGEGERMESAERTQQRACIFCNRANEVHHVVLVVAHTSAAADDAARAHGVRADRSNGVVSAANFVACALLVVAA